MEILASPNRGGAVPARKAHWKRSASRLAAILAVLVTELSQCAGVESYTLPVPSVLNITDTVRSPSGIFELGFKSDQQNNFTLAIWYADPVGTVVWVVSRDVLLTPSAILSVTNNGLVLSYGPSGESKIVLYSSTAKNIAGVNLQDDGNLVLLDNTGATLWQSFDTPTDTLLPGQPYYNTTGVLRSRPNGSSSSIDWSRGSYGFVWDTKYQIGLAWYSQFNQYHGWMYYIDSQNSSSAYVDASGNVFVVGDRNSTRLLLNSTRANPDGNPNSTFLRRVTIDRDGGLRIYTWAINRSSSWYVEADLIQDHCLVFGKCGPNAYCTYTPATNANQTYLDSTTSCQCPDYFDAINPNDPSQGCQRRDRILASQCNNPSDLMFDNLTGFDYPYVGDMGAPYLASLDTCQHDCLVSCGCHMVVYSFDTESCWLKSGDVYNGYVYTQSNLGGDRSSYFKVVNPSVLGPSQSNGPAGVPGGPAPEHQRRKPSSSLVALAVGISAAVVAIAMLMVCLLCYFRRHGKSRVQRYDSASAVTNNPRVYTYKELSSMTKNFRNSELLSEGAFGAVYRGTTSSGAMVAIKRMIQTTEEGRASFVAELKSLGQIHHRNLLQLRGWCQAKQGLFLVYEFMCNGSLHKWIHCPNANPCPNPERVVFTGLPWEVRHSILAGVASGLEYLHEECAQCVLHRDIKSSNVLLDADFNPYLGDFRLARLVEHHKMEKTTLLAGTLGYMAPEMIRTGRATKETDVFAFGMLVLEVVCGRKPLSLQTVADSTDCVTLLDSVWTAHEAGNISEMVDRRLVQDQSSRVDHDVSDDAREDAFAAWLEITAGVLQVGLACCLPNPVDRPPIRLVNQWFQSREEEAIENLPSIPATKPASLTPSPDITMAQWSAQGTSSSLSSDVSPPV